MMICYKFPDQATFHFLADDMFSEEDILICYTHDYSIHEIGSVVVTEATYDSEGVELTPSVLDTDHHVNYLGAPPEAWEPYRVFYCDHPKVMFAGTSAEVAPIEEEV
jgi:hypothetical protein